MDWLVWVQLNYRVGVSEIPPNDDWRQWMILLSVGVVGILAFETSSFPPGSSAYYVAVDLLLFSFILAKWCSDGTINTG